jgi:NAD+ kinase
MSEGKIMKRVKIIINERKPGAKRILGLARQIITNKGFTISTKPDFIIAMGGDGTLITAAGIHGKKGIPILGVNLGGLGFLTDVVFQRLPGALDEIKKGRFRIEKRMVLQADIGAKRFFALNDVTLCTHVPGRVVEFTAMINGEYICRFVADGIIVSTPTGSTAYSLASGGPILMPTTEQLILTPICPHTLSVRPLVLPPESRIEIQAGRKGSAILVADGQRSKPLRRGQRIQFRRAGYYVRLVKLRDTTFFRTLREKMKWGGREDA